MPEIDWDYEFQKSNEPLVAWLGWKCRCADAGEEIAAECWFRAWVLRDHFAGVSTFKNWLFGIAKLCLFEYWRQRRKFQNHIGLEECSLIWDQPRCTLDVGAALNTLSGRDLKIVQMRFLDEVPATQIGRQMGIPASTVGVIAFRAVRKMRREIA